MPRRNRRNRPKARVVLKNGRYVVQRPDGKVVNSEQYLNEAEWDAEREERKSK